MIQINKIKEPFIYYCQKVIPLAFDESLSYYEVLCHLTAKIKEVIDEQNIEGQAIQELQEKYLLLVDYVDHYFDNLDVQEEINNKLDDMAEQGQLTDIIAQYLQLAGVLAFDTVADMVTGENLVNGSICKCLGRENYDDGLGAFYKIRTITSGDVVDNINIIALDVSNTLIAERIKDTYINIKLYGAVGNGINDDTTAIQNCINDNPHRTIYFPDGIYLISDTLSIKAGNINQVNLKLSENAIIKTEEELETLLEVGATSSDNYDRYSEGATVYIDGGIWNAENCSNGIILTSDQQQTTIQNITMINVEGNGIYFKRGAKTSGDFNVYNSSINGVGSEIDDVCGIYIDCYDNKLSNIRINRCQIGIYDNGSSYCENIHILWSSVEDTSNITNTIFEKSIGWKIGTGQSSSMLLNCFSDSMSRAIDFNSGGRLYVVNFQQYFWFTPSNATNKLIDYKGTGAPRISLTDVDIEISNSGNYVGIDVSSKDTNFKKYLPAFSIFSLKNIVIKGTLSKLSNSDNIINRGLYNENDEITLHDYWTSFLTQNNYMPIAYLKDGAYDLEIRNSNDQIINAKIIIGSTSSISIVNKLNNIRPNLLNLAVCNYSVVDGVGGAYLCVKTTASTPNTVPYNVSIRNMKFGLQQVYTRRNFNENTYLTSPTVNAEQSFNPDV